MAISTNGTVLARLAGALYNTQMSNATYSEVKALDPASLANTLYARDFASATDLSVATTLVTNLGLTSVTGLANWVAAQLTAAGSANKGAKVVDLLNGFAQLTTDTVYGAAATAFNALVDAALVLSQTTGNAGGTFGAASAPVNATFALTSGMDTIVGGAGNDTINTTAANLNPFDSITGGAGVDTLVVDDTATGATASFSGVTLAGVEKINLASKLGLASAALNTSSSTAFPGLTDLTVRMSGAAAQAVTAAKTTTVTISNTTDQAITLVGGGNAVNVTTAGAAVTVGKLTADTIASTDANAYTSVTVTNTGNNAVKVADNSGSSAAIGSTLTDVTVKTTGGAVTLEGKGIVNVTADASSGAITLKNNNTAAHSLNVTLKASSSTVDDNSNYATSATINSAAGASASSVNSTTLAGTSLATLTISGDKALTLTSTLTKLSSVTVSGAGGLSTDLSSDGATTTAGYVTTIDTTASTAAASSSNGTIANAITINPATQYVGGAGVDNVTVSTSANTASISLGAGNDSVTIAALSGSTSGAIDGGDGTDTLQMTLALGNTLASSTTNGKISNFEKLSLTALDNSAGASSTGTTDLGYLPSVNSYVKLGAITAISGHTWGQTVNNIANGGTVEIAGDISATYASLTLGVNNATYGASDSLTIKLSNTAASARAAAGTVTVAGVETINLDSSTSASTWAAATDSIKLAATSAKTLVITGNQGLDLSSGTTNTALTSVDASAMTGTGNVFTYTTGALTAVTTGAKATIIGTSTGVNTIDASSALKGVNISVGTNSSANVLTGTALADIISGGTGNDTITSGGGLDQLTGGGGADVFVLAEGTGTASSQLVITDFGVSAVGADTLTFATAVGTNAASTTSVAGWTVSSGVYTKAGATPTDFFTALNRTSTANNEVATFEYSGDTYVFFSGDTGDTGNTNAPLTTDDVMIKLVGVTGVTSVATTAGAHALLITA